MQVVRSETDLAARFDVVVDPDAEPGDLDRFLDALDRLVERRLGVRAEQQSQQQGGDGDEE